MIAIIDYGMGNVGSIRNILSSVGSESVVTADPDRIRAANRIILPGVGAFDAGMRNLSQYKIIPALDEAVRVRKVPILGICLGMQLMCRSSEEGTLAGLGWISAHMRRFSLTEGSGLKIPHMGWNIINIVKKNALLSADAGEHRFYFVHSYHAVCEEEADVLATAHHGYAFPAAFSRENIFGVQFHPEKSHRFGRSLFERFVEL